MWKYSQTTGKLFDNNAKLRGTGYSGTGHGRNNHLMQEVRGIGPIPIGVYQIGEAHTHGHLGPKVMALTPLLGTETFDRSEFFMHGNNPINDASHGCIILDRPIRELIDASNDRMIEVVQ